MRSLITLAIAFAIGRAEAAPSNQRVVLVDPDPELLRAMTTSLKPWKLEVIVDTKPVDEPGASERADALRARFVVWRNGKDLVVFDREHGDSQHRDVVEGSLDPVDAAAAALTVKTLMRLPAPPGDEPEGGLEVRIQAGAGLRISDGAGGRFGGAVMLRPSPRFGLRAGVMAELGASKSIGDDKFEGTWSDYALLIVGGWTIPFNRFELEPWIAGGLARSTVNGEDQNMGSNKVTLDETETLPAVRVGAWGRYRLNPMWTIGAGLSIDVLSGTPTYTRPNNDQVIYGVPSVGVSIGLVLCADLGRNTL